VITPLTLRKKYAGRVAHVGQFSVKITPPSGSILDGRQHDDAKCGDVWDDEYSTESGVYVFDFPPSSPFHPIDFAKAGCRFATLSRLR
jgi:hypothetical protein